MKRIDLVGDFIKKNPDLKVIVFTETKLEADVMSQQKFATFKTLHGDLDQKLRQNAIESFRKPGSSIVLVATDVAARGLDIDDVDAIIHLGCRNVDSFVHRSGRTGRAGKSGKNFIIAKRHELSMFTKFAQDLNIQLEIGSTLVD